ncbi:MAG: hypothetical protein R3338_13850, partial [Thermoanaerobaculia bacterium]|nr:hypothetical protein [Thermoanaerobaculia bacterium]
MILFAQPGSSMSFVNTLGGAGTDVGTSILQREDGSIILAGYTESSALGMPIEESTGGKTDVFLAALSESGDVQEVRWFGGSGSERLAGAAIGEDGFIYLAGTTTSMDLPLPDGHRPRSGPSDAFVAKVSADFDEIVWLRLLGGSDTDLATGVAIGTDGSVFVVGETASLDFPRMSWDFPQFSGGSSDAFVVELSADGETRLSGTIGGRFTDGARAVAITRERIFLVGMTRSPDFPTMNPVQDLLAGGADWFVSTISRSGYELMQSTYLGGSANDSPRSIAIGPYGGIHIGGSTYSFDFPVVELGWTQSMKREISSDGAIVRLNHDGSEIEKSTFLGGEGADFIHAVGVDAAGTLVVSGA